MIIIQKLVSLRLHFVFLFILISLSACSGGQYAGKKVKTSPPSYSLNVPVQPWHPTKQHSIPVVMNPGVKRWVKAFNTTLKPNFTRWMYRLGQYGPTIESILKKEGVPTDLIYLSMIESGFNLRAMSHASAAGPWQFINSTGRMYGLDRDFFVDERSDLVQSTKAAATFLKELYNTYGDWYLAFAAYNAGPGKVNRAIKKGRTKDYWKLSAHRGHLFRQETKDYVPKILAALHIVKNYRDFGYTNKSFGQPLQFERVTVPDATDVQAIAKSSMSDVDHIQSLNPHLIMGITPPGKKFTVNIPQGSKQEFMRRYSMIPAAKRVSDLQYLSGNRETIASIAKKYHVSPAHLAQINGQSQNNRLKTGTLIKIPATTQSLLAMAKGGISHSGGPSQRTASKVTYYKVRSGDTLTRIAHRNHTTAKNISQWNNIGKHTKLKVGQRLKILHKSGGPSSPAVSGTFLATYTPQKKRVSGVKHIIMEDAKAPVAFTPSEPEEPAAVIAALDEDEVKEVETTTETTTDKQLPGTVISLDLSDTSTSNTSETIAASFPTPEKTTRSFYTVQRNDTLSQIALKHGVRVSDLKSWNNLTSNNIRRGQTLKLQKHAAPSTAVVAKQTTPPDKQAKFIIHHIKSGETLWSLSKKYGVRVNDIKKWNNLNGNQVRPKQKIKIFALAESGRDKVS